MTFSLQKPKRTVKPPKDELPEVVRSKPLTAEEWICFFDQTGKISESNVLTIRNKIFSGVLTHCIYNLVFKGICADIRQEVWKFLLDYYPWNSTAEDRQAIRERKTYFAVSVYFHI